MSMGILFHFINNYLYPIFDAVSLTSQQFINLHIAFGIRDSHFHKAPELLQRMPQQRYFTVLRAVNRQE